MLLHLATFALALAPLSGLQGSELPENDGWVTDLAGMLSPAQERSLEDLMESYRSGTTHEIALLTVPALEGRALERFALEVARGWGIGGKDSNNGALLLVSRDDRKIRIEVGRGLEGNLTDSISGRIIRDVIAPRFKQGDYPGGLRAGIEAMHAAIGGDYGPIHRSSGGRAAGGAGVGCVSVAVNLLIFLLIFGAIGRRRGGMGGILPWLILANMGSSRSSGGFSSGGGFGGGGGGFGGFGGGGGFSGGGASGGW